MPSIDRRNTVFDHVVVGKPSERPIIEKIRYKPNLFSSWKEKKIRERGNNFPILYSKNNLSVCCFSSSG